MREQVCGKWVSFLRPITRRHFRLLAGRVPAGPGAAASVRSEVGKKRREKKRRDKKHAGKARNGCTDIADWHHGRALDGHTLHVHRRRGNHRGGSGHVECLAHAAPSGSTSGNSGNASNDCHRVQSLEHHHWFALCVHRSARKRVEVALLSLHLCRGSCGGECEGAEDDGEGCGDVHGGQR